MLPIEYTIYEHPQHQFTEQPHSPVLESPTPVNQPLLSYPISVSPTPEEPLSKNPGQLITDKSIIKESSTDESIIDPSINLDNDGTVRNDAIYTYRQLIKRNIEYDCLSDEYGTERMDEVVELILETVLSNRPYIRVAGDELPQEYVVSRLLSLRSSHLQYVFGCLDQNTTKIYNIKSYLLTALFNAVATKDGYYKAAVNHDLYGT